MTSKIYKLIALTGTFVLLNLFQPAILRADEASRGIGGTGHSVTESGVGGTGNRPDTQGIGGTGHAGDDSGIGGTGIVAGSKTGIGGTDHTQGDGGIGGTGIVGIITGFGSVWVNGLEVQYDAKMQVADNVTTSSVNELAIGEVVVIEAKGKDNALQADKISVINAVEGEILASGDGKLTILGQTVVATARTINYDQTNPKSTAQFKQGDYVKVSGLRMANGDIVASRIERSTPMIESSLVGPITAINGNIIEIYGLKISSATGDKLSVGQEISVTGKMNGALFIASKITPSPSTQLYGRTAHINLQGYVSERTADGQIKVGNMEIVVSDPALLPKEKQDALSPGELVQISGHFVNDHRMIVERIDFSRDRPDRVQLDNVGVREQGGSDHVERLDHTEIRDHVERPDHADHSDANKNSEHSH